MVTSYVSSVATHCMTDKAYAFPWCICMIYYSATLANSTVFVEFPNIYTQGGVDEPSVPVALAHSAPQARMHMCFLPRHVLRSRDLDHIVSVDVSLACSIPV